MSKPMESGYPLDAYLTRGAVTADHAAYLRRVRLRSIAVAAAQILLLLLFFYLWERAADRKMINDFLTSKPSLIWATFRRLAADGSIFRHIGFTCLETVAGFLIGTLVGIFFAILLWWSDFLSRVLDPYLIVLNSTPKVAFGPIFIVWLGSTLWTIIAMALAISIIITVTVVYSGFQNVDRNKIKLLQTFGATRWQIMRHVVLPASVPTMMAALKVNVGLSFVGVITGEFLVSKAGLGYLIIYGGQVFNLGLVMTSVLILCVMAGVLYRGVAYLENYFLKWNE